MPQDNPGPVPVVISLGGSLISGPQGPLQGGYLLLLRDAMRSLAERGTRFVLITGGGGICRVYQDAMRKLQGKVSDATLDELGIDFTWMHARLAHAAFGALAHPQMLVDLKQPPPFVPRPSEMTEYPLHPKEQDSCVATVIVGGGDAPGCSTDDVAVRAAEAYGATRVINLSRPGPIFVGPVQDPDRQVLRDMRWAAFDARFPGPWKPGKSTPFDSVAAHRAWRLGMSVEMVDADNWAAVRCAFVGERHEASTLIAP
jgi:uridylate kinase